MSKFDLKPKAIALRKSGASILEIVKAVGISKSTASLWCRDIELTLDQQKNLQDKMKKYGFLGRLKGAQANKDKKIAAQKIAAEWAKNLINSISNRDRSIAGIALYWAEGSKAPKGNLSFVNSDPKMIVFMYKWLKNVFDVKTEDFSLRVYINELHRYRIQNVLNFWSNLLDFPKDRFHKTVFIKSKQSKVYANHDTYFGLLTIRVKKSTLIRYKILSLIEAMNNADVAQVARASHS